MIECPWCDWCLDDDTRDLGGDTADERLSRHMDKCPRRPSGIRPRNDPDSWDPQP